MYSVSLFAATVDCDCISQSTVDVKKYSPVDALKHFTHCTFYRVLHKMTSEALLADELNMFQVVFPVMAPS